MAHLTDFGEEDISHLKIKVLNSNGNTPSYEKEEIIFLKSNQQIKFPIQIQTRNYPLGATVLFCEY